MTTLTPEQLAHIRATALAAVDGWSPTSSSFAALEHCAASHPQAVVALCDRVLELEADRDALYDRVAREVRAREDAGIVSHNLGLKSLRLEAERDGMAKALELARARVAELEADVKTAGARAVDSYRNWLSHEEALR